MKTRVKIIFLAAIMILSACSTQTGTPTAAPAAEAEPAASAEAAPTTMNAITVEQLRNATFSGIYDQPVTLVDGYYEGEPFIEGDPARPTLEYGEGSERFGDLDGDGIADAVVFLIDRAGGSAVITHVAAQLNQGGQPVDAGAVWIDEVMVQAAEIEDGQVVVKILIAGPGDPDCCPSHKAFRTYGLVDGRLSETAHEGQDLERVSASDFSGTTWNLVEMNYGVTVIPDTPVSIAFDGNEISGSGGCNNFTGSFTLGDVNPLLMTTGSLAATQKACPDAVLNQETSYFAALEGVVQWGYVFGRLVLYSPDEQGTLNRLLFAPVSTE